MRSIAVALALLVLPATEAGEIDRAVDALGRADYPAALEVLRPLAEAGDPGDLSALPDPDAAPVERAGPDAVATEIVRVVNDLYALELITATGGNVSARIPDSHADRHWLSQSASLFRGGGKQLVNYIGRFENLDSGLEEISKAIGFDLAVEHLNRSNTGNRRAPIVVNAKIDGLIRQRYAEDISRFGYDFSKDDCRVA